MKRSTKIGIGAGGALALAGAALATGMTITSASADETPTPTPSSSTAPERTRGMDETPLTGDDATRATAAAESAVEGGTVLRVETDANDGGTYEAHVRTSEGTEVIVTMDDDFNVIEVKERAGRGGHGGKGGPGGGETPLTGDDATKATAAAESAVEGGTVLRVETDANDGGTYEAHVRTSEGTEVIVTMDEDFNLIEVKEFAGRGGHGPGHDRDGDDAGADSSGSSSDSSGSSSASSASLSVDI